MFLIDKSLNFLKTLVLQRDLIRSLTKREISSQYQGSLLGFMWAIINPLVMILLFWFVFSVGFRVQPMNNNVPFVIWLTAGLSVWIFFSEAVLGSSEMIVQNAQLIKKTLFKAQILPIVKILSALITHMIFILILFSLMFFKEMPFSWFYLQAVYYLFCACTLALGISWLFSSVTVFVRDASKFLGLFMQVIFWVTPIFWDLEIMTNPQIKTALKFNPIFYIVDGYRDSFISFVPFWTKPEQGLVFWLFSLLILILGATVFQKLKPHFPDVL
jgi:ABC-type polysaccharide/polyol phosphate export permease